MFLLVKVMDMTPEKLFEAVVGAEENGRCKNTIALVVEEEAAEGEERKLLDEFFVEKPVVQMFSFNDADDMEFFQIEFQYRSRRDADLKQHWDFLDRYVQRFHNTAETAPTPILTVSLVPIRFRGKYSVLAQCALPDSINKIEYAGEDCCSIKMLFVKDDVLFLAHDDDLVDIRTLEAEVNREIDRELEQMYPDPNMSE